jgi:hypothetical protein
LARSFHHSLRIPPAVVAATVFVNPYILSAIGAVEAAPKVLGGPRIFGAPDVVKIVTSEFAH